MNFKQCDKLVEEFEAAIEQPRLNKSKVYYTGVDLGTACVVVAVLDENKKPVAGRFQYADVVKDGMVVDYIGAVRIVKGMKEELEEELGTELTYAAAAIPPGMEALDGGAVKNVVQAAGFEITALIDEVMAANSLIGLKDGAIVDIGGGTTGVSIIKDGELIRENDEATGGWHFSLVLSGAYKISLDEAEEYKCNPAHHREIFPVIKPVIEKVGSIINKSIDGYDVEKIVMVGGSSCLTGIEEVVEDITGIPTIKPSTPAFITPLGIALNCTEEIIY